MSPRNILLLIEGGEPRLSAPLRDARNSLGELVFNRFLDNVPERGSDLWNRYTRWHGGQQHLTFTDFVRELSQHK